MSTRPHPSVSTPARVAGEDPRAVADALLRGPAGRCPVSRTEDGTWVFAGHAEVRAAALDDAAFSSAVSAHLQLPNGLDGAEHDRWRPLVDRYFRADEMARFEEPLADVVRATVAEHLGATDAVRDLGRTLAVRLMTAWLGWPAELHPVLLEWMEDNQAATRSGDRERTADVARRFDAIIRSVVEPRRAAPTPSEPDVTDRLIADDSAGRALTDEEIVSVLRNWTAGDLGSLARCVGVVVHHLAEHPEEQARLRAGVGRDELDAALDEMLRLDDPFVANRRVAARAATVAGEHIEAGDRVLLHWTAANRDPDAFGDDVDAYDPAGHARDNLVWGIGRHVCPGRPLAMLELCLITEELLRATASITLDDARPAQRGEHPVGGWRSLPAVLSPAD